MKRVKSCKGCFFSNMMGDDECYLGFEVEKNRPYPSRPLSMCHKETDAREGNKKFLNESLMAAYKADAIISRG